VIAIDTNVLLRYLLQDDKKQSAKADKLITGNRKVLVTDVVLVEAIWALKGKKYKLSKDDLLLVIDGLFIESNIMFEDGQTVWRAYNAIRGAESIKIGTKKKDADFSDALILEKSRYDANRKVESFGGLYTFDTAAQQFDDVNKL